MLRYYFYFLSIMSLILIAVTSITWPPALYYLMIIIPLIVIGIYDVNSSHNVLRNYPVIGHLRYMFEFIRPEIQQYFISTDQSGRPFNREQRSLVYRRAKNTEDTHPFGTEEDINNSAYEFAPHSLHVKKIDEAETRVLVGGPTCKKPYLASRLNISGMSFGAISNNAVRALNRGAKMGNFAQSTGEGGISPYHLEYGGDLIWQIGTGYFGCRTLDGHFDEVKFAEKANLDVVKMIEVKISQGAKPSHGGLLPAAKITREIAEIRGIPIGFNCLSPPLHTTFSTPLELLQFIENLRNLTHGKPIGFKLCLGRREEFMSICKAMLETSITPDFISIDGAEGGTGAAPLEFSNSIGVPLNEALAFVHNCLVGINMRDRIHLIASGKITNGFDMICKLALGADMCGMARAMMFAVGCIQALRCNTNTCPTGVTTQDPARVKAIVVPHKAEHVYNFHRNTMKSFLDMVGAMGISHPNDLSPEMIRYRVNEGNSLTYRELFHFIEPGNFLTSHVHPFYKPFWEKASAKHF